ncbi:protein kinase domain-containing protein [Ferrimonas senticii]|uniref:protein kinase domain-containing protein n=1 Tax=Ferrimonas senticii TaxID=394566 RepID=UPI000422C5CA|nr:hypothetical protein [Ferrimonas senticii]
MNQQQLLALLNLPDDASIEAIRAALLAKMTELQQQYDQAPTEKLQAKFAQRLQQLAQANAELLQQQPQPSQMGAAELADLPELDCNAEGELAVGEIIADRFEVTSVATVATEARYYQGHDRSTQSAVTLALIGTEQCNRVDKSSLQHALQASSELHHPQLCATVMVLPHQQQLVVVMEPLSQPTLAQQLAQQQFSRQQAAQLALTLVDALIGIGRPHGGLRPDWLALTEHQSLRLSHFGWATLLPADDRDPYLAPEQRQTISISTAADQYALGAILHQMICAEPPTVADDTVMLDGGFADSEAWVELLLTLLAPDPKQRFSSLNEVRQAISTLACNAQAAAPESNIRQPRRPAGLAKGWLLAASLATVAIAGWGWHSGALQQLLPMSEQQVQSYKSEAATIESKIKAARNRFNDAKSDLREQLQEHKFAIRQQQSEQQRQPSNSGQQQLAQLAIAQQSVEEQLELTNRLLIDGETRAKADAQLSLGKESMRAGKYQQGLQYHQQALADYQHIDAQFTQVAPVADARLLGRELSNQWRQANTNNHSFATITTALNEWVLGDEALQKLQFSQAFSHYQQFNQQLPVLTKAYQKGRQLKQDAEQAARRWRQQGQQQQYPPAVEVAAQLQQAQQHWQQGQFVKANQQFVAVSEGYQQLITLLQSIDSNKENAFTSLNSWYQLAETERLDFAPDAGLVDKLKQAERLHIDGQLGQAQTLYQEIQSRADKQLERAKGMLNAQQNLQKVLAYLQQEQQQKRLSDSRLTPVKNALGQGKKLRQQNEIAAAHREFNQGLNYYNNFRDGYAAHIEAFRARYREWQQEEEEYHEILDEWDEELEELERKINYHRPRAGGDYSAGMRCRTNKCRHTKAYFESVNEANDLARQYNDVVDDLETHQRNKPNYQRY